MGINLGEEFPNFVAETTEGTIKFHEWMGDSWCLLFSHPRDYTPVCTTELSSVVKLQYQFKKRGVKTIALSIDSVDDHNGWIKDIQSYSKTSGTFPYPLIADPERKLAKQLGMIDPDEKDMNNMPVTCRAVFIVGPDKRLKLSILYPATTGRNFGEILRVIDSLQLTVTKKVATPADWKAGGQCMVLPTVTEEELKTLFNNKVTTVTMPSGKGYMRTTPQPK